MPNFLAVLVPAIILIALCAHWTMIVKKRISKFSNLELILVPANPIAYFLYAYWIYHQLSLAFTASNRVEDKFHVSILYMVLAVALAVFVAGAASLLGKSRK